MDETRARIVDSVLDLYEGVGPAATSMSGVAEHAGVTRATLYRHFTGEADLADIVIDEWRTGAPALDPAALAAIADPAARLRSVLASLYTGYRATEALTANLLRDAHALPAARVAELREPAHRAREALGATAGSSGRAGSPAAAAVGLAVAFETWRSLAAEGLDDPAIVDLMALLVAAAAPPAAEPSRKSKSGKAKDVAKGAKAGAKGKAKKKAS
jgi:AcrR family transcriptional regulator